MLHKTTQNIEWSDLNQQKQCSLLWLGGFPLESASPSPDLLPASLERLSAHSNNKCFTILWLHIAERHLSWASLHSCVAELSWWSLTRVFESRIHLKKQQETQLDLASVGSWGLLRLLMGGGRSSQLQEKDGLGENWICFPALGKPICILPQHAVGSVLSCV